MGVGMGGTFDSVKQQYKTLERSGDASGAIDVILRDMTKELTADMDALEKAWEDAVDMAMASVQSRAKEVVFTVASRLVDIGRCALELSAPPYLYPCPFLYAASLSSPAIFKQSPLSTHTRTVSLFNPHASYDHRRQTPTTRTGRVSLF